MMSPVSMTTDLPTSAAFSDGEMPTCHFRSGKRKTHWRSWEWLSTPKYLGGLGFRDMQIFNQAMLGKQCWKLLTEPTSLCARVLQGRYFPNGDFWSTACPRSASYTWRSIIHGRDMLKRGVLWRVGDGKSINWRRDWWIPDSPPGTLLPILPLPDGVTVHGFLNEQGDDWEESTVRAFFNETDANRILHIPISSSQGSDVAAWPYERACIYSVRSAYNLARAAQFWSERSLTGRGASSAQSIDERGWKKLWKIQCPSKMKVVLWRFVHDCLPTGFQLQKRSIPSQYDCCFCSREETVEHTFLRCQFATEIWSAIKEEYGVRLKYKEFYSIRTWLLEWISEASDLHTTVFTVTVWYIWEARNAVRNGETFMHPNRFVEKINAYVDLILQHTFKIRTSIRCESSPSARQWTPPPEGLLMLNVDAAVRSDSERMGAGAVIRDHQGRYLAACRQVFDRVTSPELAEAIAVRHALSFALQAGFDGLVLASDCQTLISKINTPLPDRSHIASVVQEIKLKARLFGSISFIHVYRSCNVVAHVLAQSAVHEASAVWVGEVPGCIRQLVCTESVID